MKKEDKKKSKDSNKKKQIKCSLKVVKSFKKGKHVKDASWVLK